MYFAYWCNFANVKTMVLAFIKNSREQNIGGGGGRGGRFFFLQSLVVFFDNFEELQTVLIEVKLIIYIARLTCLPKCYQNIFNTQSFVVWQIVMLS